MKYYPYLNGRIGKPLFWVFLLVLLLLARDTMITYAILGLGLSQALMMAAICLMGVGFLAVHRRDLKAVFTDKRIVLVLVCALILLLPMFAKRDWQMMYFTILLCPLLAVFLTYFSTVEDVAKCYVVQMTVLGVYSILATYILRILPDRGIFSVPIFVNGAGFDFHNFGLAVVSDTYVKNRNFGFFREPGVYQYFIILALFLNNYRIRWSSQRTFWTINVLLAITMLTTFATGGVAELGLLVLVVFFEKGLYKEKRMQRLAAALVVAVILALIVIVIQKGPIYWELHGMIVYKFSPEADSNYERTEAIVSNVRHFLNNPLVGQKMRPVLHGVANNTSSTTAMFAMFGILGGALHVVSWLALVWERERKLWANLCLLLLMLASFNTQNLSTDVFLWLFPMMALTERALPYLENRKKKV